MNRVTPPRMRVETLLVGVAASLCLTFSPSLTYGQSDSPRAPLSTSGSFVIGPFDVSVGSRLPVPFRGIDIEALASALREHALPPKSEFEREEEFLTRARAWAQRPVLGKIRPDSTVIVVLPPLLQGDSEQRAVFDAETESFTFDPNAALGCSKRVGQVNPFTGVDAFGRSIAATRVKVLETCLGTSDWDLTRSLPMPRDAARSLKPFLRLAIVGKLESPYFGSYTVTQDATLTRPIEVQETKQTLYFTDASLLVFDSRTGNVLVSANPIKRKTASKLLESCPDVSPQMPVRAQRDGIVGQVRAVAKVKSGRVVDVRILSADPPGVFDSAVRTAFLQFGCSLQGQDEYQIDRTFDFPPK